MSNAEQWALLWSKKRNAFHIEPVAQMLSTNRANYASDTAGDYVPLFIGEKHECDATADSCRKTLVDREFGPVDDIPARAPAHFPPKTGAHSTQGAEA